MDYDKGQIIECKVLSMDRKSNSYKVKIEDEIVLIDSLEVLMRYYPNSCKGDLVSLTCISLRGRKFRLTLHQKYLLDKKMKEENFKALMPGDILRGKVLKVEKYGVFFEFEDYPKGLLNKRDISRSLSTSLNSLLNVEQLFPLGLELNLKVMQKRKEYHQMDLAIVNDELSKSIFNELYVLEIEKDLFSLEGKNKNTVISTKRYVNEKGRNCLPLPLDDAKVAFDLCEKDQDGWVSTKAYYKALKKQIKGFSPLDYGGRFNEFYKRLDFLELKVVDKNNKFLRLKE